MPWQQVTPKTIPIVHSALKNELKKVFDMKCMNVAGMKGQERPKMANRSPFKGLGASVGKYQPSADRVLSGMCVGHEATDVGRHVHRMTVNISVVLGQIMSTGTWSTC